jgi:hypothetical protein
VVRKTTSTRLFALSGEGRRIAPGDEVDMVDHIIALLREKLAEEWQNPHSERDEGYVWKLVATIKDLKALREFKEAPGENSDAVNSVWEHVLKNAYRVRKVSDRGVVTCDDKQSHVSTAVQRMAKHRFLACTLRIQDQVEQNRVIESRKNLRFF